MREISFYETIIDAIYRAGELEEMDLKELCAEANIPYNLRQRNFRTNLEFGIIIEEYGHDVIPYMLDASVRLNKLVNAIPNYPHSELDAMLWEREPIYAPGEEPVEEPAQVSSSI